MTYYKKGMKPGDEVETSVWLNGKETQEEIDDWQTGEVGKMSDRTERENGVIIGEWTFEKLPPGDERVPPVPDHIKGPDVRLLYAGAKIIAFKPQFAPKDSRFIHDLAKKDLEKLRKYTRDEFIKEIGYPPTPAQVDDTINYYGPIAAGKALDLINAN